MHVTSAESTELFTGPADHPLQVVRVSYRFCSHPTQVRVEGPGLQTVGDDYVALGGSEPAVARALFRMLKQDRAGLARIAGLAEHLAHQPLNWMNKVVFDPTAFFPDCFTDTLRIEAIVLPHVAGAAVPHFVPASAGEAMRALMRSNLYQFPGEPDDGLDYYAMLLRSLPIHRLELSDKAAENGAALAAFIAALG